MFCRLRFVDETYKVLTVSVRQSDGSPCETLSHPCHPPGTFLHNVPILWAGCAEMGLWLSTEVPFGIAAPSPVNITSPVIYAMVHTALLIAILLN